MSFILDTIFPVCCSACDQKGQYLCKKCQSLLIEKGIEPNFSPLFEGALSLYKYQYPINRLIHDLKYNYITDLVDFLSTLITNQIKLNYPHLLQYWRQEKFIFLAVPLHLFRQNWRGFNQSQLLVKKIATNLKIRYLDNLLIRSRYRKAQASFKHRSRRFDNLINAFSLNKKTTHLLKNSNFIIFDDVITTGSTLKNIAKTLKTAKVKSLWAFSVAT